jgi:methanogenic corrinoid protein MtbC1
MDFSNDSLVTFEQALLSLDRLKARSILSEAIGTDNPIKSIENIIMPVLELIGEGWEEGNIALSQIYMSGRICEELISDILPTISKKPKSLQKMAIAVLNDYHLLGKRIVYSAIRASGYDLIDYGPGLSVKELVEKVRRDNIKILLISVLMLPSALHIKEVRKMIDKEGLKVKIVVGGAPFRFDEQLWKEVGADAMGHNSSEAVKIVARITEGME